MSINSLHRSGEFANDRATGSAEEGSTNGGRHDPSLHPPTDPNVVQSPHGILCKRVSDWNRAGTVLQDEYEDPEDVGQDDEDDEEDDANVER